MVLKQQNNHTSQWPAIQSISSEIGCADETLRRWVRRSEIRQGVLGGTNTSDRERLKQLERENKDLMCAYEILRTASAFSA